MLSVEYMGSCTRISSMVSSRSDSRTARPEPLSAASSADSERLVGLGLGLGLGLVRDEVG